MCANSNPNLHKICMCLHMEIFVANIDPNFCKEPNGDVATV